MEEKKRLSGYCKAWCTLLYSTMNLLRWRVWFSCPLSLWKTSHWSLWVLNLYPDGHWFKPDARYLDFPKFGNNVFQHLVDVFALTRTPASQFPHPLRTSQSFHKSSFLPPVWVSHNTFAHSSSPKTFLFTFELSTCKAELANPGNIVFVTELATKQSHKLGVLAPPLCAAKATAGISNSVSSCKRRWFCGAVRHDQISQSLSVFMSLNFCHWRFSILLSFFLFLEMSSYKEYCPVWI